MSIRPRQPPARQHGSDRFAHRGTRIGAVASAREQSIVRGMAMTNVSADRELDRLGFKLLGSSRTADPARIFLAGVGGDVLALWDRAARKERALALRKLSHVTLVELGTTPGCP